MHHSTINHLDLTVSDPVRSTEFYDHVLGQLGYRRSTEYAGSVPNWTLGSGVSSLSIGLHKARGGVHDRYAPGLHHLAFHASSREQVDALHAFLVSIDANILDAPAEYDYTPGYYAVFFCDPDGLKLELVFEPGLHHGGPGGPNG